MSTETEATPKQAIIAWAEKHGVTMRAEFVPFSQSRNRGEKSPSLNWRVTLERNGCDILTTDYSAGCGHCPAQKCRIEDWSLSGRCTKERDRRVRLECEYGTVQGITSAKEQGKHIDADYGAAILPDLDSVLWSLSMDSSVLDAGGFESWASDYGYDTDSRAAEATYRQCLDIALKLRAALGDEALRELAEAGQDY